MRFGYLLFLGVLLGLSSCMWGDDKKAKPDINTDTLVYAYYPVKSRDQDCATRPDSACTVIKVNYPGFARQDALNDTITHRLLTLFSPDQVDADFTQYTERFFNDFNKFRRHNPNTTVIFTSNSQAKIIRQDSSLTTLEISGYRFEGGAHGSTVTNFINWNTKSKKNITLSDIMTDGYKDKLTAIADTIFRKQEKLSATASLAKDYFFKDSKFALNNNFSITPLGIKFLYNQYEIKPYAAGQTELFIPYAKIKSLLKPNTVITQYHK
jgi:hypothetical protein